MAAYAAVVSLVQLLHPDQFPLRHRNPQIESLYGMYCSLQSSLEKIFPVPKKIKGTLQDLNIRIRDASYRAEDIIESFIFRQQSLPPEILIHGDDQSTFLQALHEIIAAIDLLAKEADSIQQDLAEADSIQQDLANLSSENAQTSKVTRSHSTRIVGREKDIEKLKDEILNRRSELGIIPIVGLPGIGKTVLAQSIYTDYDIINSFSIHTWVTFSETYELEDTVLKMLSSMERSNAKEGDNFIKGRGGQPSDVLYRTLYDTTYLVVLDDVWDREIWDRLRLLLPDRNNGSRIVLTTRDQQVPRLIPHVHYIHEIKPLDEENSWYLLCEKVFGDRLSCPSHLKVIGQEIAQKCGGVPLSLTVIGGLLYQEEKTKENWKSILEDVTAAAAKTNESYLELISLIYYDGLPVTLKACFLYMGAFPENTEFLVSKLIKLWVAEGFINPRPHTTVEQVAAEYLDQLLDRDLLVLRQITSDGRTKTCAMHKSLPRVAAQECERDLFFHSRKRYAQKLSENTNSHRRLSIHKNDLMCLKRVYDSAKSMTSVRTIVYAGPYHDKPLPFCLTFDLLRVLDAFSVYFIVFPQEIVKLIQLRYLSFTYNHEIPSSISKLQKLQTLIIRRYPKIVFLGELFLPVEIWDMPQLRHLIFAESDFPMINPLVKDDSIHLLPNLQTLTNVNARSCTKEALRNMPNLKKLRMWTEASGVAIGLYLDQLQQLESFKFTVLDPTPMSKVEFQPKMYFPNTLRKLTLSGCSLPWEDMAVIAQLPCLEVLKLREMAFQGDNWSLKRGERFLQLRFLLLEYLDLKFWEAHHFNFPMLQRLILKQCYHLEGIPPQIVWIEPRVLIELVDCSPYAVDSTKGMMDDMEQFDRLKIRISSSWEKGVCMIDHMDILSAELQAVHVVVVFCRSLEVEEFKVETDSLLAFQLITCQSHSRWKYFYAVRKIHMVLGDISRISCIVWEQNQAADLLAKVVSCHMNSIE